MIIIESKCEVQDFNWTKYPPGNEVGGLPGLFLFKSVLLVFSILFGLQFLALMIKSFRVFLYNTDP